MGGGVGCSLSTCFPTWRGPRAAPRVLPCSCPEKTDLCLRGQVRQVLARREPRSCQVRGGLPPSPLGPLLLLQVDQILIYIFFQAFLSGLHLLLVTPAGTSQRWFPPSRKLLVEELEVGWLLSLESIIIIIIIIIRWCGS